MNPIPKKLFKAGENNLHERLDVFLAKQIPEMSRSGIQKLIACKNVTVNDNFIKSSYKLNDGDVAAVKIPENEQTGIVPENIPLNILYEDEEVLVVNKSAGMIVHPVKLSQKGTLVNALLAHTRKLSTVNGLLRPGIVHRLDKDTSGVLIVAKSDRSHLNISEQIKRRKVKKIYKALVLGGIEPEKGEIAAPVGRHAVSRQKMSVKYAGGREAVTSYEVIEKFRIHSMIYSFLNVSLKTGRTHQIRVHMASIGHPVAADAVYGKGAEHIFMKRQALHAELIGFLHPVTGKYMEFRAPLPEDIKKQIKELTNLEENAK